ncbi:MAG: hypothetical protein K6F63_09900 [Lachnospiraceae bacterium]|nr:hypothetical protein [Lachnospiraceae bacterium]
MDNTTEEEKSANRVVNLEALTQTRAGKYHGEREKPEWSGKFGSFDTGEGGKIPRRRRKARIEW